MYFIQLIAVCQVEFPASKRDFARTTSARPVYSTGIIMPALEALEARLKVLEDEILRLTKLASQTQDQRQQDTYLRLAQDLQHEARSVRAEIEKLASEHSSRNAGAN